MNADQGTAMGLSLQLLRKPWHIEWDDIRVARFVGGGSVSDVSLGKWRGFNVAIKAFKLDVKGLSLNLGSSEVSNEADFLLECRHANLITFYGIGSHDSRVFALSEFTENGSLDKFLSLTSSSSTSSTSAAAAGARSLTHENKIRVARDMAAGMHYLHSLHHMHSALKSESVFLTAQLQAKVGDYGTLLRGRAKADRKSSRKNRSHDSRRRYRHEIVSQRTGAIMSTEAYLDSLYNEAGRMRPVSQLASEVEMQSALLHESTNGDDNGDRADSDEEDEESDAAVLDYVVSNPFYMAPEALNHVFSFSSDVWSFGEFFFSFFFFFSNIFL
jgi:serine/threonine protein kinase